jgi:hypothetical protein
MGLMGRRGQECPRHTSIYDATLGRGLVVFGEIWRQLPH